MEEGALEWKKITFHRICRQVGNRRESDTGTVFQHPHKIHRGLSLNNNNYKKE